MKKNKGQIGSFTSLFFILFLLVGIVSLLQIYTYHIIKENTEDALAASNLASAVTDIEEYGISHSIVVKDPMNAFDIYKDALKVNMGLDEELNSINTSAIIGRVIILDYIVYNVRGSDVDIYHFGEDYYFQTVSGGLGVVTAPNGTLIKSTSVYSKISFNVKGIFDINTVAVKDNLVSIVRN